MRPFFLLLACCVATSTASAQSFSFSLFAPSAFSTDVASMDAALGISGYTIEDFEDVTLVDRLSYRLEVSANPGLPFRTTLPAVYRSTDNEGTSSNHWDDTGMLVSTIDNTAADFFFPQKWAQSVTFSVLGGASNFGVGLSNFQSESLVRFPVTDHELFVNGTSFGLLESFVNWEPRREGGRNGYLRIDGLNGAVINQVTILNLRTDRLDVLGFDRVAFQAAPQVVVPEPGTVVLLAGGLLVLIVGRRAAARRAA